MTTDTTTEITGGDWKTLATTEITHLTDEEKDYLPRAWDEWIARVRRDAQAEAWEAWTSGLATHLDGATPRAWGFHHPCDPPGERWEPSVKDRALMEVSDFLRDREANPNPYRTTETEEDVTAHPIDTDRLLARIARLEAQSDIRGRAVVIYRERAREAEAERDEWRQTALDERGAALDLLEQIKARDKRIQAVLAALGLEVGDA